MELTKEKLEWFEKLKLKNGAHQEQQRQFCVMEAVAYVAGEPHSDAPKCASRVVARFAMRLNDRWDDKQRQALKPFVLRIAGTAADNATELRRAFMCADWAVRELAPIYFDAAKLAEWAERLRALPAVVDKKTAEAARDAAREGRNSAADAAAAADAAYATYAANAAADAALDAAYAAAYAAGRATLRSAREKANASALDLLDRLIRVTERPS